MLHVGLTGGLASGKSSVAALFAELGAWILDADELAREVTAPGSEGLAAVLAEFGEAYRTAAGELDRPALARHVFRAPGALQRLEALLHPRIQETEQRRAGEIAAREPRPDLLFLHGQDDDRVPPSEAEEMGRALRHAYGNGPTAGVRVEMLPGHGHSIGPERGSGDGVDSELERRLLDWFRHRLVDGG